VAVFVHTDQGDAGGKHGIDRRRAFPGGEENLDGVGHRGGAGPGVVGFQAEDGPFTDAAVELHLVHGHGHEPGPGEVQGSGDPGRFVHPAEEMASEEEAKVIEVLRQNEFVIFHGPVKVAA